jgi:hypothetical protein
MPPARATAPKRNPKTAAPQERLAKRGPREAPLAVPDVLRSQPRDATLAFRGAAELLVVSPGDPPVRELALVLLLLVTMSGSFLGLTYETWRQLR